jgi:hypothetical protein
MHRKIIKVDESRQSFDTYNWRQHEHSQNSTNNHHKNLFNEYNNINQIELHIVNYLTHGKGF